MYLASALTIVGIVVVAIALAGLAITLVFDLAWPDRTGNDDAR